MSGLLAGMVPKAASPGPITPARQRDRMDIYLYDTMAKAKRRFEPLVANHVRLYVCGPTVYDYVHIGNAVPTVAFDVLVRLLRLHYEKVTYVRNITDIEDKINAAAKANGEPIEALTARFAAEYAQDAAALGALAPDIEPRATDHIAEIIATIETLIARGHAYEAAGHVLFHVPSQPSYGSLSKQSLEHILEGARVEVAPYKRDPKDFVMWKPSTPDLPGWSSPWGRGRPGWHIECTAMIRKHLGADIDIHGGGSDLTFPHHENELAQGVCAAGHGSYARYWVHNGMLRFGKEKMSKSVGNIVTIRELLRSHAGETLRYALLSGHYRHGLDWSDGLLRQAGASLDALYQALVDAGEDRATAADYRTAPLAAFPESVLAPLRDDLNTPRALAALHGLAGELRSATDAKQRNAANQALLAGGWLLGLLTEPAPQRFQRGAEVDHAWVEGKIVERTAARAARDFARADAIRDELAAKGVELEDRRDGTRWRRARPAATN